jgi:L-malate glycosyltransferase
MSPLPTAVADSPARAVPVCHIMTADLWAGAEVQLATTASYLVDRPDVRLSVVLMNEGQLASELRRLGIDVTVVDEGRHNAVHLLVFLARFLRDNRIDLVHTHRYKDSVLGTIAAKLAGVPFVVRTVHGLREPMSGWQHLKFRVYETVDRVTLLSLADLVIAVSKQMEETLRRSGYRPTMLTHIHNGIDLHSVAAGRAPREIRRELAIPEDALLFGTVGRLSPVKDHAAFLEAAAEIRRTRPDARFVIVGGGPLERELRRRAAQLGLEDVCLFTGPRIDAHNIMAAIDVFVLPSLSEGIPMAVLEAMALGRPVVATAVGGVPEVVQHGTTGLLVEPGNPLALAQACLELAGDPKLAAALGNRARQTVEARFTSERSGRALLDAYRSVTLIPKGAPRFRCSGDDGPIPPAASVHHADGIAWLVLRTSARLGRDVMRRLRASAFLSIERRRMHRRRRNPAAVASSLQRAGSILVLCKGNIVRSPFAAALLTRELADGPSIRVRSAGLEATPGNPADPTAQSVAAARGLDLSAHRATPVTHDLVAANDVIFVMDVPQLVALRRRFPAARPKTFLLSSLAPDTPLEVHDPLDEDEAVYGACFDHIASAIRPIVQLVSAQAVHP